jgi:hypothetical protein
MQQFRYVIKLDKAIMKFDYDRVKELILYYPDNAREYLMNYDRWKYCITNNISPLIIDILEIIFDYCTVNVSVAIRNY